MKVSLLLYVVLSFITSQVIGLIILCNLTTVINLFSRRLHVIRSRRMLLFGKPAANMYVDIGGVESFTTQAVKTTTIKIPFASYSFY